MSRFPKTPGPHAPSTYLRPRPAVLAFSVLFFSFLVPALSSATPQYDEDPAVSRAQHFLMSRDRGKEILAYVHLGADYRRHDFIRYVPYDNGGFALVYRFLWKTTEPGYTVIAFSFNSQGNFASLRVVDTDATISMPFLFADFSIKVLGNMFIETHKNDMKREDIAALQKLIDNADSKAMLEWSLRLDQLFGS
jgi:hypothetical protein